MNKYDVPFFANTPDDTHCFQASLKMVLKYFWPEKDFSWKKLDKLTDKKKGKWTWAMRGLINLRKMGFEVINSEKFDYKALSSHPQKYLESIYGKEATAISMRNSDMEQVKAQALEFANEFGEMNRIPEMKEIKDYLDRGYLVGCNVNANPLLREKGYMGHFVVMTGYDNKHFYINDPGAPPKKDLKVTFGRFKKAWAYPDRKAQNIMAFKYS